MSTKDQAGDVEHTKNRSTKELSRKELVDAIQKHTQVARADVDKVLGSLIQHTQVAVKKGDRVALVGFGTFERQDRRARTARNPRSGAPVKKKATKVPRFRAGQGFKDVVSGKMPAPKLTNVGTIPVDSVSTATEATKMIQIRHVPPSVHQVLKDRASQAGMSLTDYLLRELTRLAERPSIEEVLARIEADGSVIPREDIAEAVHAEREAR
jgi:DNA-binding protein HU-beta